MRSGGGVFQHYAWIEGWWASNAGSTYEPSVGVCWDGDDLVAVLPCAVARYKGVRVLEWAAQAFSDYGDGIGAPELMPELLEVVIAAGGFDLLRLKNVRPDAIVASALQRRFPGDHGSERCLGVRSAWRDGESWFATLNKKKRNNHRRGLRILAESGAVAFRQLSQTELWTELLPRLVALKRARLEANKQRSKLLESDALHPLVGALQEMGCLHVFVLECDGAPVAGLIAAAQGNRLLAFFAAYDRTHERGSPGILLINEVTKWAFDQGLDYVDYLRGDETYKFEFANDETRTMHFVSGRTLIGRSANLAHYLWVARRRALMADTNVGAAYYTASGTPRQMQ